MKKFTQLNADQKRVRVILIISIITGIIAGVTYANENLKKGLSFDLTLFGGSFLIAFAVTIGVFFAIVIALMQKDKPVL